MDRRSLLKFLSIGTIVGVGGRFFWPKIEQASLTAEALLADSAVIQPVDMIELPSHMSTPAPNVSQLLKLFRSKVIPVPEEIVGNGDEGELSTYFVKMENFESSHLEHVFSDEVSRYGFFGEKVITKLTTVFPTKNRIKVSSTGHFLFRGEAENLYERVKKDLDENVVLTSGIRSIVKQTHLFLAKTIYSKGNLSKASRSLAPPVIVFMGLATLMLVKLVLVLKISQQILHRQMNLRNLST